MYVVVSEIQMESIALREKTKKQNSLKCLMHTHSHQHSELKFLLKPIATHLAVSLQLSSL